MWESYDVPIKLGSAVEWINTICEISDGFLYDIDRQLVGNCKGMDYEKLGNKNCSWD